MVKFFSILAVGLLAVSFVRMDAHWLIDRGQEASNARLVLLAVTGFIYYLDLLWGKIDKWMP